MLRTVLALLSCLPLIAQTYYSAPPADAPELAARGKFAVGVRTLELVHPAQPDILHFDREANRAPLYDRPLTVDIWYPATLPAGAREHTEYESAMPGNPAPDVPRTFRIAGKALRDAPPLSGTRFPLVVVSHGYPGSRTFLTWLTENLASKGYVVASIDHTDSVFGQQRAFTSTLLNRAADQLFTMDELIAQAAGANHFLHGVLDPARVAVVGYSMGGYGALASAGAGYSPQGGSARAVPGDAFKPWLAGTLKPRPEIKAVVAIAPWGAQPPQNNWDAAGLAGLRIPSFFIAGDHDDVSGYEQGTRKVFEGAAQSDRYLLTFENARHNVGGNPPPPEALGKFTTQAFFDEPVWRKDRIAAINQHFITAFLDLYLKGDESRRAYLSDAWKGFQPRWSLGIKLEHRLP
jgi:predicted dienelactone hydrolase